MCIVVYMARTNIDIDEELVRKAMAMYRLDTKREAVGVALRKLVGDPMTLDEALGVGGGARPRRARAPRASARPLPVPPPPGAPRLRGRGRPLPPLPRARGDGPALARLP